LCCSKNICISFCCCSKTLRCIALSCCSKSRRRNRSCFSRSNLSLAILNSFSANASFFSCKSTSCLRNSTSVVCLSFRNCSVAMLVKPTLTTTCVCFKYLYQLLTTVLGDRRYTSCSLIRIYGILRQILIEEHVSRLIRVIIRSCERKTLLKNACMKPPRTTYRFQI